MAKTTMYAVEITLNNQVFNASTEHDPVCIETCRDLTLFKHLFLATKLLDKLKEHKDLKNATFQIVVYGVKELSRD